MCKFRKSIGLEEVDQTFLLTNLYQDEGKTYVCGDFMANFGHNLIMCKIHVFDDVAARYVD